jgi:CBS domain-containing protein
MIVSEIMNVLLCTVEPEATVGEAATLMGERGVGSVIVVANERLEGILTERDIVRALSTTHDAPQRAVVEWMTKDPVTIAPDTPVKEALRAMVDGGFRHLPVTEGDRVVGMISIRDLAGSMAD